jgi:hypothetical protein
VYDKPIDALGYGSHDGRQYAVQVFDHAVVWSVDVCIPIIQRWHSSTWTLSPKMEVPVSGLLTMSQFATLLEPYVGIPAASIMVYKPSVSTYHQTPSYLTFLMWYM